MYEITTCKQWLVVELGHNVKKEKKKSESVDQGIHLCMKVFIRSFIKQKIHGKN